MATRTIKVCDREPDDDDALAVDTVVFEHNGKAYELDLCASHLEAWKKFVSDEEEWMQAARPTGRSLPPPASLPMRSRATRADSENAAIREWARQQGINIGDRGRIPVELRERFRASDANRRWRLAASEG